MFVHFIAILVDLSLSLSISIFLWVHLTVEMEMEIIGEPTMRVQGLAEASLSHVPPQYIQPLPNCPQLNTPSSTLDHDTVLPVIHMSEFDPTRRESIRESIGQACRVWGAFHVTNHSIFASLLDHIKTVGLTFFNHCPLPDKLKYSCNPNSFASQGYGSKMIHPDKNGIVLDWRDYFNHHTFLLSWCDQDRWPHFPPNYKAPWVAMPTR